VVNGISDEAAPDGRTRRDLFLFVATHSSSNFSDIPGWREASLALCSAVLSISVRFRYRLGHRYWFPLTGNRCFI
jgi:hypothetical protein